MGLALTADEQQACSDLSSRAINHEGRGKVLERTVTDGVAHTNVCAVLLSQARKCRPL